MADFDKYLCVTDGLPPLWPSAPTWTSDSAMRRKVEGFMKLPAGVASMMLDAYLGQRELETQHRQGQRKCDVCGIPCEAECFCGEVYCSRSCQRQDWKNHRRICATVFENHSFGLIATQIEFTQFRSDADLACSMGTKPWPSSPGAHGAPPKAAADLDEFSPGTRCILEGLTSPAGALLNGMRGQVMGRAANSERLLVRLSDNDPPESWKKIQACNLRRTGPPPPPSVAGAAEVLKQAGASKCQDLSGALRVLVAAYPDLTGPQYLHLLRGTGTFCKLDAVRDAHVVRRAVRAIKGPLVEKELGGSLSKVKEFKDVQGRKPDWVSMSMSFGGGPRGTPGRMSESAGGIADWPEFFLQEGADIYGKKLTWTRASDSPSSPSGSTQPVVGGKPSKKAAQRQRQKERAREAAKAPAAGTPRGGDAAASMDGELKAEPVAGGPRHLDELYIWLIDAYRMRCHDDLQWRGGVRRGIYEIGLRVERRLRPLAAGGRLEREEICDLEVDDWGERTNLERPGCCAAYPTRLSVTKDFFMFCKLVERIERYPPYFDFTRLLSLAHKLLPKRFQKDHAKFKYGDENALAIDRPSLRRFCESVYSCTIVQLHKKHVIDASGMPRPDTGEFHIVIPHEYDSDHQYPKEIVKLWDQVERYFEAAMELSGLDGETASLATDEKTCFCDQVRTFFADVGGIVPWRRLYERLDLVGDNFGLPHALAIDPHVPLGSTVMVKNLRSEKVLPSGLCPADMNGSLGTLIKVSNQEPPRYEILTNGGGALSVQAHSVEVNVEKIGEMSMYGRMHLNMGGGSMLAADIGGYSSLSEGEEEGDDEPRLLDAAGKFRRRKGLERIGEARRMEEGPTRRATYTEEAVADEDEELQGCEVNLVGLQSAQELNGRRGRVVARNKVSKEGEVPRYAVMLLAEPGEERRHVSVRRENLVFVDARAEWEERMRDFFASKKQEPGVTPRAAARGAADPDVQTPLDASKQRQKRKSAKSATRSPPLLSEADKALLKQTIAKAVSEAESERCKPRSLEPHLRTRLGEEQMLAAQRLAEATTKARSHKQGRRDRQSGLGPKSHWLARLWSFVLNDSAQLGDNLPRYSGKHRVFMLGPDEDTDDEGGCMEDEDSEDEAAAFAAEASDTAALANAMEDLLLAPSGGTALTLPDAEPVQPAAAAGSPMIGPAAAADDVAARSGAESSAAEGAGSSSFSSAAAGFSALSASEEGESSGLSKVDVGAASRTARPPPPTSMLGFLEEQQAEADLQEPAPVRRAPEPGPPTERWVHRFYGIAPGTIFVIPPRELYFTQDSIRSEFKDRDAVGADHTIRKMLTDIVGRALRKREIELMEVVYHEGYYYSCANRRLAAYLLASLCDRCPRVKVLLVDKDLWKVNWERRFTTRCHGDWIMVRQTGERVGRTLADTDFRHPELDKVRRRASMSR